MVKRKTQKTDESVDSFINSIEDDSKREDCRAIMELMRSSTGLEPKMWGSSIIGFGKHLYSLANSKTGEICNVGFAPRSRSFAFYLREFPERAELIEQLGKHRFQGGCLHITKLADVNIETLSRIVEKAHLAGSPDAA